MGAKLVHYDEAVDFTELEWLIIAEATARSSTIAFIDPLCGWQPRELAVEKLVWMKARRCGKTEASVAIAQYAAAKGLTRPSDEVLKALWDTTCIPERFL